MGGPCWPIGTTICNTKILILTTVAVLNKKLRKGQTNLPFLVVLESCRFGVTEMLMPCGIAD